MPFDPSWLTSGGAAVLRVVLSALLAYVGTVVALRTFGKRSIAKLSAFDFVVTVALGSALASIVLARDTPIVEGLVGIATLLALQRAVAFGTSRSHLVRRVAKSRPRLLVRRGRVLEDALRAERVGVDEVRSALRREGIGELRSVAAVVLETDGTLSVIREAADDTTLADVVGWQEDRRTMTSPETAPA
jgi:uncharacterized membrane protein YcaP (DUF421 family)